MEPRLPSRQRDLSVGFKEAKMAIERKEHARVTPEELERVKSRMGKTWRRDKPIPFLNTQATRDTIRHYCEGIGDMNWFSS